MIRKDDRPGDAAELRRRAEAMDRRKAAPSMETIEALTPEEIRRTLHELRVHQIELEMQNEELRLAQVEMDAARARYFDLYNLAPVGYCTVSEQGLILEATVAEAGGGAPVYRVVMSDITGRKRTEEALQKALDEIRTLRGIREMEEGPQ